MTDLFAQKIYTLEGFAYRKPFIGDIKALDIGCGTLKLPGAVGMDILPLPTVDIVHDVNQTPWPINDNTFDLVFLNHALEHVQDVVRTMEEIHRVCKPGGHVVIQVPYFRCVDAFNDPTHVHFFTANTLEYFIEGTNLAKYHYSNSYFRKLGFWYGWPHDSKNPLAQMIKRFIHTHTLLYDQYLSNIAPVRCLTWELEKIA
jgi:SAM-dependent methyltransferase